jgi:hypothetical protein
VEWKHFQYTETTHQLLRKTSGKARVKLCTSEVSFEVRYKPGGTATAALGNWSHRAVSRERDPTGCGRWSYVTYDRKGSKLFTYILAYTVCNHANLGDTMARRQNYQMKYADETARVGEIDPRRQTMVDLEYFVDELIDDRHGVVIFMDVKKMSLDAIYHKLTI